MSDHDKEYVVPAQPGWFVLSEMLSDGDAVELYKEEVLAWKITVTPSSIKNSITFSEPVTINSRTVGSDFVLLTPAGRVVKPEEASWDTLEMYQRDLQQDKKLKK